MEFEWDAANSDECFAARGFDFAYAIRVFLDPQRMIRQDERKSYGEERYQLFGRIDERLFVVVFTYRSTAIRIISARKANAREVRAYEDASGNN
ncbi:hypothetical protein C7964_10770 [Loktanella sp. PT4BL]|jgi:hypothetical protein|uniref:BrnT family toxin n=1 Tax=Loktanella sp. PT4BL TaxID=2135611 RepID=UPI000D772EF3|nr:BrnT family toxin [Loktanella sp. PT4BL]PXW67351.1 hypothetical protein C7964_10770 [Loktanella sp. PT4BL]